MFDALLNSVRVPELKKRLIFTAALIAVFRLCAFVVVPGVNPVALAEFFKGAQSTLFSLVDMFAGGAFTRMSIVALGIMPYISASIIMQLLTAVIPALEKLSKEGEAGRKKITQYTRYATVALSAIQGSGVALWIQSMQAGGRNVVAPELHGPMFLFITVVTLITGTMFLMWLGEQITEKGIGNGISIIIFVGIVGGLPNAIIKLYVHVFHLKEMNILSALFIGAFIIGCTAAVVILQQGQRRVPITYARQIRGNRVLSGQGTYLPLKVDYAGIIAVIFASSILMFPATIMQFIVGDGSSNFLTKLMSFLEHGQPAWAVIYFGLIIFFCYFYTAITFNPNDIAENLRKSGASIPGRRPGKATANYLEWIMTRITLVGAVFVALIALVPEYLIGAFRVPFYFGGTSLLIVVGVALDTIQQIESHLTVRHYDGFMKKGRIRGRR